MNVHHLVNLVLVVLDHSMIGLTKMFDLYRQGMAWLKFPYSLLTDLFVYSKLRDLVGKLLKQTQIKV